MPGQPLAAGATRSAPRARRPSALAATTPGSPPGSAWRCSGAPSRSSPARSSSASGCSARSSASWSCRRTRWPRTRSTTCCAPSADHWFGTDKLGPRRLLARHRRRARHPDRRAAGDDPRHRPGHRAGPRHGLLPRRRRRRAEPDHRGVPGAAGDHHGPAGRRRARPVADHADPRRSASSSRRSSPAPCAPPCSRSASSSTWPPRGCATSARPTSCSARSCPTSWAPIIVEFTVRLGYAIFTVAALTFLGFGIQPPAPDWGLQVSEHYGLISGGFWWPVLFPSLAIATLVDRREPDRRRRGHRPSSDDRCRAPPPPARSS